MNQDMNDSNEGWRDLIGQILARREGQTSADRAYRARVRKGINSFTQHYAEPEVLQFSDLESWQDTTLIRCAAITAEHTHVPQYERGSKSLGQSFYEMSRAISGADEFFPDPAEPDNIANRIHQLSELAAEDAALAIHRILGFMQGRGLVVAFDYFNMTRTLLRWGKGFTPASLRVRRSILRDYYRGRSVI